MAADVTPLHPHTTPVRETPAERLTADWFDLSGTVVVVTGAARGIGAATAQAFAELGADLVICDRLADELAETESLLLRLGAGVLSSVMDVRDQVAVEALADLTRERFGVVDVLVNNAGGGFHSPFLDVSPNGQAALVAENFTQVTSLIRATVPLMTRGGSIVNVTSIEAHRAGPGFGIYSAMKAAVASLTATLALELADRGIRVNAVAPDMIPTPGDQELVAASAALTEGGIAAARPWPDDGTPADAAAPIVFLAAPAARFITGTTVHVGGGTSAALGWRRGADGGWRL
jgi:NAD(P)-dependent dehydrogenase (short-subunit alcohol dehydrogenase family)